MNDRLLFDAIEALYPHYLDVWEDVCNIESPTQHKAGVDAVGAYFADMAKKNGWQVETLPCAPAGDALCITMNPQAEGRMICLSGHLDTVHAVGSFGTPAVRRDKEKIYGPGVSDCKGGIVAGMLAMEALQKIGFQDRPVRLLLQTDEECSSRLSERKTINYIIEKAKGAAAFLNLEGYTPDEGCLSRKGITTFTFTVQGVEAHSAHCAVAGANAIAEAAYKIIELEKLKDNQGLTCNCAIIRGGTVPNTVPGLCEFYANVRFVTQKQLEEACAYAQTVADTVHVPGCSCTVTRDRGRVAMEYTDRNQKLLDQMNEIYAACGMPVLHGSRRYGGSDAADVTVAGIPCIDSLGVQGGGIHSSDEYAYLISLKDAAKRVATVVGHL